jgi:hypothetical protein
MPFYKLSKQKGATYSDNKYTQCFCGFSIFSDWVFNKYLMLNVLEESFSSALPVNSGI